MQTYAIYEIRVQLIIFHHKNRLTFLNDNTDRSVFAFFANSGHVRRKKWRLFVVMSSEIMLNALRPRRIVLSAFLFNSFCQTTDKLPYKAVVLKIGLDAGAAVLTDCATRLQYSQLNKYLKHFYKFGSDRKYWQATLLS